MNCVLFIGLLTTTTTTAAVEEVDAPTTRDGTQRAMSSSVNPLNAFYDPNRGGRSIELKSQHNNNN